MMMKGKHSPLLAVTAGLSRALKILSFYFVRRIKNAAIGIPSSSNSPPPTHGCGQACSGTVKWVTRARDVPRTDLGSYMQLPATKPLGFSWIVLKQTGKYAINNLIFTHEMMFLKLIMVIACGYDGVCEPWGPRELLAPLWVALVFC